VTTTVVGDINFTGTDSTFLSVDNSDGTLSISTFLFTTACDDLDNG